VAELLISAASEATPLQAMARSRAALDRALEAPAALSVLALTGAARSIGAFQRRHGLPTDLPLVRRGSGGPDVTVGPGTLHVLLALRNSSALVPCDAARLLNRHVRPLLRALTREGALAHYFGRDWISVAHRPVGQVAFAHDARTGRCTFEAFVAVEHPFAPAGRVSHQGKPPGTVSAAAGRSFSFGSLRARIIAAYGVDLGHTTSAEGADGLPPGDPADGVDDDPPWAASAAEAIGLVAAGPDARGDLRVGGDLLASRDALDRLAARAGRLGAASRERVAALVDEEMRAPGVALEGVASPESLADVIYRAVTGP
jgi:hypothetical protein